MSLINQVLSQLERRGVYVEPEQDMVRAVSYRRPARRLPLLLLVLSLAAAAWWWQARGGIAGGAKPQQVAPAAATVSSVAPGAPVMPAPVSAIAVPNVVASQSAVPVAVAAASAVQTAGQTQPVPKPASPPAPKPLPAPKAIASVPPKQSALATPDKAKPGAVVPVPPTSTATPKVVAIAPPKPAASAAQTRGAVKPPAVAPSVNKAAPKQGVRPDKRQPATVSPAPESIPMKQVSRAQQAEAEFRKGIASMQQGRSDEAVASYQAALQLDSGHDAARQALVARLLEEKRGSDAERLLQERLDAKPDHIGFAMLRARLQVERGATGEAQVTLERSLPFGETKADYLAFLAALQQRNNFHAEAVAHYRSALQLQPGNGAWLMGCGISLQALRRNEEAKAAYQQALDSKTLSPELQAFVQRKLKAL